VQRAAGSRDELACDLGPLGRALPFAALKATSPINARTTAANDDPRFPGRIRDGLPRRAPDRDRAEVTR